MTTPDQSRPAPRLSLPARIVISLLLLAAVTVIAVVSHFRDATERRLEEALRLLKGGGFESWEEMQRLDRYNNLITLGRLNEAREEYLQRVVQDALTQLREDPPTDDAYRFAGMAVTILEWMPPDLYGDTMPYQHTILTEARRGAERIAEHGTFDAWTEMLGMFRRLNRRRLLTASENEFWNRMLEVPTRPFRVRDAITRVQQQMDRLRDLMVTESTDLPTTPLLVLPASLTNKTAHECWMRIYDARSAIEYVLANEVESDDFTREMRTALAVCELNTAILLTHHLLDKGEIAARRGTSFIAHLIIDPTEVSVPDPGDMYVRFRTILQTQYSAARRAILEAALGDDANAMLLLLMHHELILRRALNEPATIEAARLDELRRQARGELAGKILQTIDAHPDSAVLLTDYPVAIPRPTFLPPDAP